MSGPAATWGLGAVRALRFHFAEVNAAGGIHGRQLRLIAEDHQYQVVRARQAANKLVPVSYTHLTLPTTPYV